MAVALSRNLPEVTPPTADELMRVDEAAKALGVTPKAVRAYVRRGFLDGHQVFDPTTKRYKTAVTKASVAAMKDGKLFLRSSGPSA